MREELNRKELNPGRTEREFDPFRVWLEDRKRAIELFFEELKTVDADAYLDIPLSFEEWKAETDPILKMATLTLFTMWLNYADLKEAWRGWFYKEGKYLVMIEPTKVDYVVAIVNRETNRALVDCYYLPKEFEPLFLIDPEGVI